MRRSNVVALGALVAGAMLASACAHDPGYEVPGGGASFGGSSGAATDAGMPVDPAMQPTFGPTVTASVPPPPISGGTMLVTHDGHTVVAANPARDQVYVVDVSTRQLLRTIALQAGDEPGRLAEDGAGRVHVALRSAGFLATLDPAAGTVLARRAVCPAPRGVAWDASVDAVHVACATGELVTLPSAGGAPTRKVTVERDLRDVVVRQGTLSVSLFRSASVLRLASDGSVASRYAPGGGENPSPDGPFIPHVAWRVLQDAAGDTVMVHQLHADVSIPTGSPGAYGSPDNPTSVIAALTILAPDGTFRSETTLAGAALPVDVAISADGGYALVAAAGNALAPALQTVLYLPIGPNATGVGVASTLDMAQLPGPATSVAFDAAGEPLAQTLEPAALWILTPGSTAAKSIPLSSVSRADTGHAVFHAQAGGGIACASCHPEGGDDGHVWTLDDQPRRTPSLRGTVAGTSPYHWPGDESDFPTLVNDVYAGRMSGVELQPDKMSALSNWVLGLPAPPSPSWVDAAAAQRGKALFEGENTGCSSCHNGAKLTNNATLDVGTGGAFQVPPLVGVGWRTPLLHDGCATSLEERFTFCATSGHGSTSSLTPANVSDLVAYLQTL